MKDYSLNYSKNKSSQPFRIKIKLIFFLAILITTFSYLIFIKINSSPVSSENENPKKTILSSDKPVSNNLTDRIEKQVEGKGGSYSVYVYDINSQKEYSVNGKMVITAASINKIPILAALYYLAGKNEIDLEKIIVPQPSDIQDYGAGTIRNDPTGTPYSLKSLARLMIQKSDNTAAYLLGTQIIGLDRVQKLVEDWGLEQTDMVNNKSSAQDISKLFIKIYKGEITTKPLTMEMLEFMSKSDYEDRLPKGLPEGIVIYHKTGDEIGKLHDAGIVDLAKRPYYIGIFTMDITDEEMTKRTISDISKTVYDYMKAL